MFILPLLITLVTLPFTLLVLVFTKLPKPVSIITIISAVVLISPAGHRHLQLLAITHPLTGHNRAPPDIGKIDTRYTHAAKTLQRPPG